MKPAWQSSAHTGDDFPERAVDGNTDPVWSGGSCFFTGYDKLVYIDLKPCKETIIEMHYIFKMHEILMILMVNDYYLSCWFFISKYIKIHMCT